MGVGSKIGVVTDLDGNFSITLPASVKKLSVSYVGMNTREVDITPGRMSIQLEGSNMLDEVITVAYGTASAHRSQVRPQCSTPRRLSPCRYQTLLTTLNRPFARCCSSKPVTGDPPDFEIYPSSSAVSLRSTQATTPS